MNRAQASDHDDYADESYSDGCGNGCDDGWVYDCFDGLCVNAEDGCELCMRRCDWCNSRKPASADTRPEGGDSTQIEAPFTGGAVPHEDAADAQQPDPQDTSHKRMGE